MQLCVKHSKNRSYMLISNNWSEMILYNPELHIADVSKYLDKNK